MSPTQFDVTGFIQAATLDPSCAATDALCGGTITVNNQPIIIPRNTILQMPAAALTWQQVFALAPPPYGFASTPPSTGLAMSDIPAPLGTYEAHVVGNRVGDEHIAGLVFLAQHSLQSGQGFVNWIDDSTGEFRVGGTIGSATTGARVRINDPLGRFGRAWTPDQRFTIDENNPTVRSETGYPMCIPRGPSATGDALCPQSNRPLDPFSASGFAMTFTMPAPANVAAGGPDPRLMAPFEIGDYVTYSGILVADPAPATTTYVAAFTVIGNVGLFTARGSDPAYVATDVMLLGVGGITTAGATEATARTRFEGFTTDPSRNILLFAVDVDPCSGADSARDWGVSGVDQGPPTGAVMGRWRYRPSGGVNGGGGNLIRLPAAGTFLPPPREMRAAIETAPGSGIPAQPFLDAQGNPIPGASRYQAPIFEFLFPENAGVGTPVVPNNFEDFPFLVNGSGPLDGAGALVGRLDPWPLGFTAPAAPVACAVAGTPLATAGVNQIVASGASVTLQGAGIDPGGLPITFTWTQTVGSPIVALTQDASTGTATFTAPTVAFGQPAATLTFQLVVTNSAGVPSAPSTVTVTVNPVATDTVTISLVEYRRTKFRLTVDAGSTAAPLASLRMQAYDANGNPQGSLQPMAWTGALYEVILVGVAQPTTVKVFSDRGGTATSGVTRLRD